MAGSLFSNAVITFFVNTKQAVGALDNLQSKFTGATSKMLGSLSGLAGIWGLKGTYDQLQKIVQLSERWQLPVEDVSRFINLFSQFGGDAEEATQTIEHLQELSKELSLHSEGAFKRLSAMINQNLQNKDYKGALEAFRNVFNSLNVKGQNDLLDIVGTKYQALYRMLRASNDEYEKANKNAGTMRTITQDQADTLTDVDKKLAEISQRWNGIKTVALETFEPIVDILLYITKQIESLPDSVIHAVTVIKTVIEGFLAWGLLKGIGRKVLGKTAASVAASATTGGGLVGAATAGVVGAGVATAAGLGYLAYKDYELSEIQKNRTATEKAQLNNLVARILGKDSLDETQQMTRVPIEHSPKVEDWIGKLSTGTTNDNRSVTINIYGVDGAEDMMSQLRGLPVNNISPISWK